MNRLNTLASRIDRVSKWISSSKPEGLDEHETLAVAALGITSLDVLKLLNLKSAESIANHWEQFLEVASGVSADLGSRHTETNASTKKDEVSEISEEQSNILGDTGRRRSRRERDPSESSTIDSPVPDHRNIPETELAPEEDGPDLGVVDFGGFSAYEWSEQDLSTVNQLSFSMAGEHVQISWPPYVADRDEVVVYRLVMDSTGEPYSPDKNLVHATTSTSFVDTSQQSAFQHVQVWANIGSDIPAAKMSQPILHARGLLVSPPTGFDVVAEEGQVRGRWHAADEVHVDVMWIEADRSIQTPGFDSSRQVTEVQHLGFAHHDPPPGKRIEYRLVARVERPGMDGKNRQGTSPLLALEVETLAMIEAVTDLEISRNDLNPLELDLSWTPPAAGRVDIFRMNTEPPSGLDRQQELDQTALDAQGLIQERRLFEMANKEGERTWIRRVSWPRGWSRAWFIPVTVLENGKMKAGPPQVASRPPEPVGNPILVERVSYKILTFEWPVSVDVVRVYITPIGVELNPNAEVPVAELTEDKYRRFGGIVIPEGRLGTDPATVYVVSTSYSGGRPIFAPPIAVSYPGLRQIRYKIIPNEPENNKRKRTEAPLPGTHRLMVEANSTWEHPLPLGLYVHRSRLPLSPETAEMVPATDWNVTLIKDQIWIQPLDLSPYRGGYVRLLARVDNETQKKLAIHDPTIEQLRIQ